MLYDYEAIFADLEAYLQDKHARGDNSFGHRELTEVLAEAKVRHRVPEGLAVKALRLYGSDLAEALSKQPDTHEAESLSGNGQMLSRS